MTRWMIQAAGLVSCGWLLPGGAHLLEKRYAKAALFLVLVCGTFAAGIVLGGGNLWPRPEELQGLDGFTALVAKAGAAAKALAGAPYLLARISANSHSYVQGQIHAYGTTLLTAAGLINLLAIADALERNKPDKQR
jgi:Family of unknown function (DUF6677)